MKSKQFFFPNLVGKSKITFSSEIGIDFSKPTTHILIYFNDNVMNPDLDFFAEMLIFHNNQKQTTVFNIEIPKNLNIQKATIKMITNGNYDLNDVLIIAE